MTRKLVAYVREELRESELSSSARALALLLSTYSLATGECTVSQAELGDVLGVSRHTIRRAGHELEAAGLVAIWRSTLTESTYRFPVHPTLSGVIPNAARVQHGRAATRAATRAAPVQRGKEGNEVKEHGPTLSAREAAARGLIPPHYRKAL